MHEISGMEQSKTYAIVKITKQDLVMRELQKLHGLSPDTPPIHLVAKKIEPSTCVNATRKTLSLLQIVSLGMVVSGATFDYYHYKRHHSHLCLKEIYELIVLIIAAQIAKKLV